MGSFLPGGVGFAERSDEEVLVCCGVIGEGFLVGQPGEGLFDSGGDIAEVAECVGLD